MSECSGDFYQSHGYFINSAYRGVQLICKLQRLMLSPKIEREIYVFMFIDTPFFISYKSLPVSVSAVLVNSSIVLSLLIVCFLLQNLHGNVLSVCVAAG